MEHHFPWIWCCIISSILEILAFLTIAHLNAKLLHPYHNEVCQKIASMPVLHILFTRPHLFQKANLWYYAVRGVIQFIFLVQHRGILWRTNILIPTYNEKELQKGENFLLNSLIDKKNNSEGFLGSNLLVTRNIPPQNDKGTNFSSQFIDRKTLQQPWAPKLQPESKRDQRDGSPSCSSQPTNLSPKERKKEAFFLLSPSKKYRRLQEWSEDDSPA